MMATAPNKLIATINVAPIGCFGMGVCELGVDTNSNVSEVRAKEKCDASSGRLAGQDGSERQFLRLSPYPHGNFLSNVGLGNPVS